MDTEQNEMEGTNRGAIAGYTITGAVIYYLILFVYNFFDTKKDAAAAGEGKNFLFCESSSKKQL